MNRCIRPPMRAPIKKTNYFFTADRIRKAQKKFNKTATKKLIKRAKCFIKDAIRVNQMSVTFGVYLEEISAVSAVLEYFKERGFNITYYEERNCFFISWEEEL